jgi:hypothetical protein
VKYDIPFVSQYADLGDHEWRSRGCGIASLAMVLGYWHRRNSANRTLPVDMLLRAGLDAGAYREGIGWTHAGLFRIARDLGYDGQTFDFAERGPTPKDAHGAWQELLRSLADGPVMASVFSGLDPGRGGGHIVVVTGWDGNLVSFADPEEMTAWDGNRLIVLERFLTGYKRRFIAVRPRP